MIRTCYGGGKAKGDKPCISHRPHEAQIYGATYIQQAYLMKDQFTKEQFQIIDKYIDTLYKKYIGPWTLSELGGPRGFIQMADGTISVLSYLAWKDKPEEVAKWIKKGIKKANRVVYKDGYTDLLYRRGGSYERLGNYQKADEDLKNSLKINPDDAYVLNYLAYSWLERDYKIDEAMEMLEKAYALSSNDPYITDSIGWAYYLIENYLEAEKYIRKAVELMPDDPTVNDHYGDILWKLNRNIQARYFWNYVLKLDDTDDDIRKQINIKIIEGLNNS